MKSLLAQPDLTMAKKKEATPDNVDLAEHFAQHYERAETFQEADTYLSTKQVVSFVEDILPGYVFLSETLIIELQEAGYRKEIVDGEVMWLLRAI